MSDAVCGGQEEGERTELDAEDVRAVVRLDEHDLVFVREVERAARVLLDREVEHGRARLEHRVQVVVVAVHSSDELGAPEAELRAAAARDEDGSVVDGDGDDLLCGKDEIFVPEGRRELAVSQKGGVLRGLSVFAERGKSVETYMRSIFATLHNALNVC